MISDEKFERVSEFTKLKRRELLAEGFVVVNIFDVPNCDPGGDALCGIDDMVIGFEIVKDGLYFNRFFGNNTFLFWEELALTSNDPDSYQPITTVSEVVEGALVHIDGAKSTDHYRAILEMGKGLKSRGLIGHEELVSAARRYSLSFNHACKKNSVETPAIPIARLVG